MEFLNDISEPSIFTHTHAHTRIHHCISQHLLYIIRPFALFVWVGLIIIFHIKHLHFTQQRNYLYCISLLYMYICGCSSFSVFFFLNFCLLCSGGKPRFGGLAWPFIELRRLGDNPKTRASHNKFQQRDFIPEKPSTSRGFVSAFALLY